MREFMIQIAAVDDNPHDLQLLQNYLKTYEENSKESFRISCFSDGKELLTDYRPVFDIILMDIEMAQIDGMTAAEEIRRTDKNVVIIFLTNMPQYAIKGGFAVVGGEEVQISRAKKKAFLDALNNYLKEVAK